MKALTPKINFEPWKDPYTAELTKPTPIPHPMIEKEDDDENGDLLEEGQIKGIFTPMGFMALPDEMTLGKRFKLWIGHANYPINQSMVDLIEKINGVETLDVMTKYRFRVGIGQMFKDRHVMSEIQKVFSTFWNTLNNGKADDKSKS